MFLLSLEWHTITTHTYTIRHKHKNHQRLGDILPWSCTLFRTVESAEKFAAKSKKVEVVLPQTYSTSTTASRTRPQMSKLSNKISIFSKVCWQPKTWKTLKSVVLRPAANLFHFCNCNIYTNCQRKFLKTVVLLQTYLTASLPHISPGFLWYLWPQVYLAFSGKVQHLETNIHRQMSLWEFLGVLGGVVGR